MAATLSLFALITLIAVALIFDLLNGLHDAANSIATVVSTRVLRPQYAVAWAAFFNFIAFLFFGLHVAQTVGTGIVAADVVDAAVIFGALMGAICWNLITWWLGIPSSSSHALIGGLAGPPVTKAGLGSIGGGGLGITAAAIVCSPLLGCSHWCSRCRAPGPLSAQARRRWTTPSVCSNSSRRRSTRWGTGAMTRRRRWASSRCCSTRKGSSARSSTSHSGSS